MSNRQRGVVLTDRGQQRLEAAIAAAQNVEKFGKRFTQAELSERANLSIRTIRKVREGSVPVDESSVKTLFNVFGLELETADYGQPESTSQEPEPQLVPLVKRVTAKIDWGEKPDTTLFFGRTEELETLSQWVMAEQCRVVTLLGMGGIGKTSLAAKLTDQIHDQFDYVIWRSLREAPPLDEILVRLIQFLSDQQETEINLPSRLGERIIRLLHYLREHRCLLVLDNLESILQAESTGQFRDGYEGYGELIHRIGEADHQSCLLLTSRECPRELAPMAGDRLPVRLWSVTGIDPAAGREILQTKGLNLDENNPQSQELIDRYSGNPQALHLVATAIQREFLGDVDDFLEEEGAAVEDVRTLLDQHLTRLAPLERSILFWLAINREPVGLDELMEDLLPPVTKREVRSALRGLSDRYLIEMVGKQFTLQNVIMEFATDRFVEQVNIELQTQQFDLFHTHSLIKATAKDYVRETQIRLILRPIETFICDDFEEQLSELLQVVRQHSEFLSGYVPGNLLNLLCQIRLEVKQNDFSGLTLRQTYLKGMKIYGLNLEEVIFVRSTFTQPFSRIYKVTFSPDGELLAAGDSNGSIHLWHTSNQQKLATLEGHSSWIGDLRFSSDGQFLTSCSGDSTSRLWSVEQQKCISIFRRGSIFTDGMALSPDASYLAVGNSDSTILLWDIRRQNCLQIFKGHTNLVESIAFSPNGQFLATGGGDFDVRLWDIRKQNCLHIFKGHTDWIVSVEFSPNGNLIATGGHDSKIRIWDVRKKRFLYLLNTKMKRVQSLSFSPDGNLLASGGENILQLWDIRQRRCLHVFEGHSMWIWSIAFNRNSWLIASGSHDSTVRLWNIQKRQCFHSFTGYTNFVWQVTFSPDGKFLASGSGDSLVRLWSVKHHLCLHVFTGHKNFVWAIAFSPDGKLLASGSDDSTIRLWNIRERKCICVFREHLSWVRTVAFSPDGKLLASGSNDYTVRLWDIQKQKCIHVFKGHTNEVRSLTFSPCGKLLVSSGSDSTIRIWNLQERNFLYKFECYPHWIRSVDFHPNSQLLVSGRSDHTIRLFDVKKKQCIHVFKGHVGQLRSTTFSPDGELVVSGGHDFSIRLWDIRCRKPLRVFKGDANWVESVSFSPDGILLASGGSDGTIRFWDVQTGACRAVLQIPRPYEGTNVTGVRGLTEAQRASMIALGAVDHSSESSTTDELGSSTLS